MKWDLTYLFDSEEDFLKSLEECKTYVPKLGEFKGKLSQEGQLKDYLKLVKEFEEKLMRTYQYAHLKGDQNRKDVKTTRLQGLCEMLLNQVSQATSFESPEILAMGREKVMAIIENDDELKEHKFGMEKLFRSNEHVLDGKSESLISNFGPMLNRGSSLYSSLAVSDSKAKEVKLKDKSVVKVTQGSCTSLIANASNAKDRQKIFEAMFSSYEEKKNTYAEIYNTIMLKEEAVRKTRNYNSILEAHLFNNNIPVSVYKNLVKVASKENKALKKFLKLKKDYLGLKQIHTYDRFIELAHSDKKYSFDQAKEIFFESIKDAPQDFQEKAREVLKDGFVDVYESDGKRSGAYSSSMPNLHPFILLNYHDMLDDVFTVAHEAGHSIHSLYAQENQPTSLQGYTIFVAEIASTFNEHMLLDHFIKSGNTTKEEKIMLLQKAIDEIYGTFYRQTLFAEYELEVSKLTEAHEIINHEVLSNIMVNLYKKYYGINIKKEKVKEYVWAYIPHLFYTPFYVYQYATSFAASFKIYKNIKDGAPNAWEQYLGLLKAGGSKYPVQIAKEAGVDFEDKSTFLAVTERMDYLVSELENLLKE